jgi:hypothetical protein
MSERIETDFISWSQAHFNMLADGGTWAIPRSGLIFQRRGARLVLVTRMPWDESMGITAERLLKYQVEEYEAVKLNCEKAGIPVVDKSGGSDEEPERWIFDALRFKQI